MPAFAHCIKRVSSLNVCFPSSSVDRRVILEPAGALAVAGLKKHVEENNISGSTFVAITSGANMDFNRLRIVAERADDSERSLMITIPETPGAFRAMYSKIWPRNVTALTYRYKTEHEANVFVSFQPLVHVERDYEKVMEDFTEAGFPCTDLTHDELAITHVKHLAGGRSNAPFERLFRFHFPEVCVCVIFYHLPFHFHPGPLPHLVLLVPSPPAHCSVSWIHLT
jgi:threonine dehydratase